MAYKIIIYTGAAIAALGPMHPIHDCNPRIELCGLSEAAYLPDEPAPKRAPSLIFAPTVAGSTVSAPSSAMVPFIVPADWGGR